VHLVFVLVNSHSSFFLWKSRAEEEKRNHETPALFCGLDWRDHIYHPWRKGGMEAGERSLGCHEHCWCQRRDEVYAFQEQNLSWPHWGLLRQRAGGPGTVTGIPYPT
jgi:hypothetical protein